MGLHLITYQRNCNINTKEFLKKYKSEQLNQMKTMKSTMFVQINSIDLNKIRTTGHNYTSTKERPGTLMNETKNL